MKRKVSNLAMANVTTIVLLLLSFVSIYYHIKEIWAWLLGTAGIIF